MTTSLRVTREFTKGFQDRVSLKTKFRSKKIFNEEREVGRKWQSKPGLTLAPQFCNLHL